MKLLQKYLLLVILLVAIFLRFFQLGTNPPSLTWDETAWGYNAYSLGIDGKDEFGRFLPLDYLESFGDFKPPVYAYVDVLPVKLFGLNEFATRFPSAALGSLTVLMTYFLTLQIFYTSEKKRWYGLIAAGVLAISPWHIMLSRAAFEANVATFFMTTGIYFFLKSIQEKSWMLSLSAASFVISMYTFNTERIVSPLLVIVLTIGYHKKLLRMKKQVLIAAIIGILLLLPTARFLLTPQARLRFQEVNIFSDLAPVNTINQEVKNDNNVWWSKILHNRRAVFSVLYLQHYFDNLTPTFLFIQGDGNPKFSIQDVGQMYIWDIPFFVVGIFLLLRKKEGNWWVIPVWLLLGIIPAATARETPHALRIEATLPTFQIFVAYGITWFIFSLDKLHKWKKSILVLTIILLFVNVFYFTYKLFTQYPIEFSDQWQYGYKNSIAYVKSVQNQYDEVRVDESLGRPYIYYLFYLQEDPKEYRATAMIHRDAFGFVDIIGFGKYRFTGNVHQESTAGKKILYITGFDQVPSSADILQRFYLKNGQPILTAYTL